jgi:hypothetical protein
MGRPAPRWHARQTARAPQPQPRALRLGKVPTTLEPRPCNPRCGPLDCDHVATMARAPWMAAGQNRPSRCIRRRPIRPLGLFPKAAATPLQLPLGDSPLPHRQGPGGQGASASCWAGSSPPRRRRRRPPRVVSRACSTLPSTPRRGAIAAVPKLRSRSDP